MNLELCAPYQDDEKAALFQMYPTKSLGPDGMPLEFFQKYWDVVGGEVSMAVRSFLVTGRLARQSAFIPGRLITDNSLIANEVCHFINTNVSEGVMSLKLDMSKAYDRMEWIFLEVVLLDQLGFDEHWVKLVMQCVSTVSYSFRILINGKLCGSLNPTRGLRQGNLSPYLFLICAEVFSVLLEKKTSFGLLQGITICFGAPNIHHLLFADNSLLFGKASENECINIRSILADYEAAYGQQINLLKSEVVFSRVVFNVTSTTLAGLLEVRTVEKHEKWVLKPWVSPPAGWLKANLDGAFQMGTNQGGIGVVFRDSTASVVGGICLKVFNVYTPKMVEAFTGRAASEFAVEFHLSPLVFEYDCSKVVKACSGYVEDESAFGHVIADIKTDLSTMPCSFFAHVFRESNLVHCRQIG
ncbi:PREDICTED: uncharacterized protein LOC101296245 [Fragaria vesca subsp. vesca]|uniref:uncharacterized protein LOC101296245 n=1 Tax=Fragaria vesca subsp. vesca TaxID=101020 RepID=UPI0002C32C40|nr:PREDICTED: uncharacterized protein LOC101296245 [Fragaria vesca subsp. vesca]